MIAASPGEARIIALAQAYRDADYRWENEGAWQPLVIGSPAPALEAMFPQASGFGLLSAWNPQSVELSEAANRAADDALHAALLGSGLPLRPAFASARNRSWREPGWMVAGMPPEAFDALVRRFDQLGAVYVRRGRPVRLRLYHPAPQACPVLDHVDWVE